MGFLKRLFTGGAEPPPPQRTLDVPLGRAAVGLYVAVPPAGPAREAELERLGSIDAEIRAVLAALPGARACRPGAITSDGAWWAVVYEGEDVDSIWAAVSQKLTPHPFPRGSFALKRDALSGNEERVRIEWDG